MGEPGSLTLAGAVPPTKWLEQARQLRHDLRASAGIVLQFGQLLQEEVPPALFTLIRGDMQLILRAANQLLEDADRCLDWEQLRQGQSRLNDLALEIKSLSTLMLRTCGDLAEKCRANQVPEVAAEVERIGAMIRQLGNMSLAVQALDRAAELPSMEPLHVPSGETMFAYVPPVKKQGRLLIVDDQEANLEILIRRLGRAGYEILTAANGELGLAVARGQPVDLVLLDICMPVMDGLETLQVLKANPQTRPIPVIMLSASSETATIAYSLRQGAEDFVPKPFDTDVLLARIESALERKRLREQEKSLFERTLSLHLPPSRVKQILQNPELLRPGADKQELSLLFTDISNFSRIADRLQPERLFKLLNSYFSEAIACVHQHEGTVIQLIGDSVFALWNAPEKQPEHPRLACQAALALRHRLRQFNADNVEFPLLTRMGLHTGAACVGNLGSTDRLNYTAIGAEVNVASRLEGLNTHLGTEILVSSATCDALGNPAFTWRSAGYFRFKGFDHVIEVFELLGDKEWGQGQESWLNEFARGLAEFKRGQFAASQEAFQHVQAQRPEDGPAQFYLRQIEKLQAAPPPTGWLGEINMEGK